MAAVTVWHSVPRRGNLTSSVITPPPGRLEGVAVSQDSMGEQGFLKRRVPMKWVLIGLGAMLVIMVAIVVALVLIDHDRDETRRLAAAAATSSTMVTSPYDFSELAGDTDLDALENAAFVSILIANDLGNPTSYGISSDLPAARALSEAIRNADKLGSDEATAFTAAFADKAAAGDRAVSTITFVFADRGTMTFFLDIDAGVVARGEEVWRADGDLRALVEDALAGNQ
jgi:hypothetical protein